MTNRQRRYFSRRTQATRVGQLVAQIRCHPHGRELLKLIEDQVSEDTHQVLPQVFSI